MMELNTTALQVTMHIRLLDRKLEGEVIPVPLLGDLQIVRIDSEVHGDAIFSTIMFDRGKIQKVHIRYIPVWKAEQMQIEQLKIEEVKAGFIPRGRLSSQILLKPFARRMEQKMNARMAEQWNDEMQASLERAKSTLFEGSWGNGEISIALQPPDHFSLHWIVPDSQLK